MRILAWRVAAVLAVALLARPGGLARAQEDEEDDAPTSAPVSSVDGLRPGLIAAYRSLAPSGGAFTRIDSKPSFTWGGSSPHPRIAPGPFEAVWTGVLSLREPGPIVFDAFVGGEVEMTVDGAVVLRGRGESETARVRSGAPLERTPGEYGVRIAYRSLPGVPARVQVGWEGQTFAREPVPAWRFKHAAGDVPEAAREWETVEAGRAAVVRLGCARCHAGAFPGVTDPLPGPSLADADGRLGRAWLMRFLDGPAEAADGDGTKAPGPGHHQPALFPPGREGVVERSLVADYLLPRGEAGRAVAEARGNHRVGRLSYIRIGCVACHRVPDPEAPEPPDPGRTALTGLGDRFTPAALAAFIADPSARYPDGRMPRLPVPPDMARDIAAYLLMWSPAADVRPPLEPRHGAAPPDGVSVTPEEVAAVSRRFKVSGAVAAGRELVAEKGCARCHSGLGDVKPADIPIRDAAAGCMGGRTLPRFAFDDGVKQAIAAYLGAAGLERHPSPFEERRRMLVRAGCERCHARDSERAPPIEVAGAALGGSGLEALPFLRTPRLSNALSKYTRSYLIAAIREGVGGVRHTQYSYRMPAFGPAAETLAQALAEADGDLGMGEGGMGERETGEGERREGVDDPTLHALGPGLVGFQGYSCVSCHLWNGQKLSEPDPGSIGPDLATVTRRIRREWFDRWLDDPGRAHPGTPMPQIFTRGAPAPIASVLEGDAARQKDALWAYFSKGPEAPSPKPLPPIPVEAPPAGAPPIAAQVPVRPPDRALVEGLCVLFAGHDLAVIDLERGAVRNVFTGGRLVRVPKGRIRTWEADGTPVGLPEGFGPVEGILGGPVRFEGYDRLKDGVRLRWRAESGGGVEETIRLAGRVLTREVRGGVQLQAASVDLGAASAPPARERLTLRDPDVAEGSLERPGYRAVAYPRPKMESGEDLILPVAIAADPASGRVFVASLKMGEVFAVEDPKGDGSGAQFIDYTGGRYQEAFSMLGGEDGLYVLHRRNLTRVADADGDGTADRFDRVAAVPHGVGEVYDYAYGLARDRSGAFVINLTPWGNRGQAGSGGTLRFLPGRDAGWVEAAYGMRNALGWCAGPEGEIFFTDNQGEWVAANKLCHEVPGQFYGFPNPEQAGHAKKPAGRTAVWAPYGWARSINGVAWDGSGGRFGPFAGQFFMAELMYGGAILRASVEKVRGEYQGACFPFWGKGLLGPVSLAFDPKGRLWVGGITEPGWMSQPDRGALFRIDFTGEVPFEIRSIHARPEGFRLEFTAPVDAATAAEAGSYAIEHYRYEYTGAYGSPELDRARLGVEGARVGADGMSVELETGTLAEGRVYLITAGGVRSARGEGLVHATGAYTMNEVP